MPVRRCGRIGCTKAGVLHPPIILTPEEQEHLTGLVRRRHAPQSLARRANAILLMVEGRTHQQVAVQCRVCPHTVGSWRIGFLAERLAGLADIPRPGAPRRISDVQLAQVVRLTLETKPKKATHWSTRSIAVRCGMSNERIARIWQAFGLQPHRSESFQLFTDPFFVEKVRDVVGLYQSPPQNALVLCAVRNWRHSHGATCI
jgi:transposase